MSRRFLLAVVLAFAVSAVMLDSWFARAEEPARGVVRVGFVHPQSPARATRGVSAFWQRLRELGWIEGQNLAIEARWAEGRYDRLPALMAEVLGRKVDVLVTYTSEGAAAAKHATSTVPIVDAVMIDPVRSGFVTSLAHPGGNLTGLSLGFADGMAGKWLELLQEVVPRLSSVAVIANPDNPMTQKLAKDVETIGRARGIKPRFIEVRSAGAIDRAFEQAGRQAQGVLVLPDSVLAAYFVERRGRGRALAEKYRIPDVYPLRDYVDGGGLMSYGPDLAAQWRRAAEYVDKILRGAKPGDLPIEQPTKFELVVNLKTAKALGVTVPESILLRADEVIR